MRSAASGFKCFPWSISITLAVFLLTLGLSAQTPSTQTRSTPPASPSPASSSPDAAIAPDNSNTPQAPSSAPEPTGQPAGQQPSGSDQGMFVFKKQVQEVVLHATVLDVQRHLVPYLDKSAFSVFESGVPQSITSFRREDVPVAMGIVVDNSGSMRDKREQVNQAVLNLIRASNPQDEIFVVNFSQNYYLDQDFTSDVNLLQTALHQASTKGSTALYDAIVASAVHLMNNPRLEKKVLLIVTDGQDNMSQETLEEAAHKLQQGNGPTLYAIGLVGNGMRMGMAGAGREALQTLSDRTGGVAYFPDTLDQVSNITREIARDVRSQYVVAYKPRNQNARPTYQSLRVVAHAPGYGPLTVRTRSGYYQEDKGR